MTFICHYRTTTDVIEVLREHLPHYIVNCFVVTGFDNMESICDMDISNGPGNSITEMENYIDTRKTHLPSCLGPNDVPSFPFQFPPGHRIQITKLVSRIQKEHAQLTKPPPIKKQKQQSDVIMTTIVEDIPAVTNEIRRKLVQWIKSASDGQFADMKEGEDYEIIVSRSLAYPDECSATIRCSCKTSIVLQRRATGTRQWIISNWSKHVKHCKLRNNNSQTEKTINLDFSSPSHPSLYQTSSPLSLETIIPSSSSTTPTCCITISPSPVPVGNTVTQQPLSQSSSPPSSGPVAELLSPVVEVTSSELQGFQ